MRCLLDKVTARYAMQGLNNLKDNIPLKIDEIHSLDLLKQAKTSQARLFIVPTTWHTLNRLWHLPHYSAEITFFLQQVEVMEPTRYHKRWTRRLRASGFSAEDAQVLWLATFGSDKAADILSVNFVATND